MRPSLYVCTRCALPQERPRKILPDFALPGCARLSSPPVLVALVTVRTGVHVVPYPVVVVVRLGFGVAVSALENRIVRRVGMARRTHAIGSAVVGREPGVIEGCSRPRRGGMASGTSCRETSGCVVGIRRALIIRFVA